MENGKFEEFGESFGENDVIGCFAVREREKMGQNLEKIGTIEGKLGKCRKVRENWGKTLGKSGKI